MRGSRATDKTCRLPTPLPRLFAEASLAYSAHREIVPDDPRPGAGARDGLRADETVHHAVFRSV